MAMGSEGELWTTRQVAEYLGVGPRMVHYYMRTGRIRSVPQRGHRGRSHLFDPDEVDLLLKWQAERQPATLEEAIMRALRAEALARDTAQQLNVLYEVLGLGHSMPDMTTDGIHTAYHQAKALADPTGPEPEEQEVIELSKLVLRINEEYLRLVERQMADPEPWNVFSEAIQLLLRNFRARHNAKSSIVVFHLVSAQQHLRNVAFEFVRTCHGHIQAEQLVEQTNEQVDELIISIIAANFRTN